MNISAQENPDLDGHMFVPYERLNYDVWPLDTTVDDVSLVSMIWGFGVGIHSNTKQYLAI